MMRERISIAEARAEAMIIVADRKLWCREASPTVPSTEFAWGCPSGRQTCSTRASSRCAHTAGIDDYGKANQQDKSGAVFSFGFGRNGFAGRAAEFGIRERCYPRKQSWIESRCWTLWTQNREMRGAIKKPRKLHSLKV
jgi:hypothetical protein